jgi:hypothetical protein
MDSNDTRFGDGSSGTMDIKITTMDKGFKIWQAVISFLVLLITVVTLIVNQSNKIETQALRINYLESTQRDNALVLKEINQKLTDILIKIENKEDKKK